MLLDTASDASQAGVVTITPFVTCPGRQIKISCSPVVIAEITLLGVDKNMPSHFEGGLRVTS